MSAGRPAVYEHAILRWLHFCRLATTHQVVYRFFVYAGRSATFGFRVVKRLKDRGLVRAELLHREAGARSREVLMLTSMGSNVTGLPPYRVIQNTAEEAVARDYHLQFAELLLEREADGWQFVPARDAYRRLIQWGLAARPHWKNDHDRIVRDRLRKARPLILPCPLLVSRDGARLRFVLAGRPGISIENMLAKLTRAPLGLLPTISFEVMGADEEQEQKVQRAIQCWAKRRRLRVQVSMLNWFEHRPPPRNYHEPRVNRYARAGAPDPLAIDHFRRTAAEQG